MKNLLIKILMVGVFGSLISAQTNVNGVISSNTTWSTNVNIVGNILVSSGVTLTIEPGVTVAFQGEYYLQIEGSLVADGNATSRIKFTNNTLTPAGDYWHHIYFKSNSDGGSISYCHFQYGGKAGYFIKSDDVAAGDNSTRSIKENIFEEFYHSNSVTSGGGTLVSVDVSNSAGISPCIIENNLFKMDHINDTGGMAGMYWKAVSGDNCNISKNIFIKDKNTSEYVDGVSLNNSQLKNNIFVNIDSPISIYEYSGASTISNNIIINKQINKAIRIGGGSPTISNNTIINSEIAQLDSNYGVIYLGSTPTNTINPIINSNNILSSGYLVTVWLTRIQQSSPLNFENNFWGTTVSSEILAQIYDYNDDFNLAEIDIDPYLTSPNTTAPISPPTGVTQTSSSGSYVISWSANPESDVAGYKIYYGVYTGYSFSNVKDVGNATSYDMTAAGLESYLDSVIAVTAYDNNADGTDDQVEGYESWFSIVPYSGPVWHVSKTGSDDNDGSEDSPFITIQKGIDSALSGDTIRVGAHIIDPAPLSSHYYSKITITDKNLTILSDSGADSTKIDGGGTERPVTITGSSAVTMKGFSITNGLADNGGGINISSTGGVLLENLNIYGNLSSGEGGGIFIGSNIANTTINSCKIYSNQCVGSGGGIINHDSTIVQNTLIYNNEAQTDGGGMYVDDVLILRNSTLAYNFIRDGRYGPAIDINTGLDSLLLLNNIFYHNYRGSNFSNGEEGIYIWNGRLVAYNNYFQGGDNNLNISRGSGNIFSDTDPFSIILDDTLIPIDYHFTLSDSSSANGTGISSVTLNGTTYNAPITDFNGASRPQPAGTNPDMGAIEYNCDISLLPAGYCDCDMNTPFDLYGSENYDCSGNCILENDCAGVCGGNAAEDCTGECGGTAVEDCAAVCNGTAVIDDCGECNGNNANMNECGVCDAQYSCNPFLLSNEKDTISLKVDTLTFTFSVPMDTLTFSAINLASTEIDNIEFHTSQDADSIRTLTLIINSPLVSKDTLTLIFPPTLQSSFGYPFDGNQDGTTGDGQTITLYTETLADYNHDNAIDFDDMTTFIASWYADDYDKELGPVTGTAPHLIPTFDNAFDIEDIITFMLMWNWANDFIPTPAGRIKDSGIPPNIVLQDGILQLDLSEYLENIAAVRIQLSTLDPKVKVISEGIQSPFDITLLRSWEEDNIYEWNLGNPQGKHFNIVQLCHLETMQKQNLHLVIDYEIISIQGNILSSGRTALDHIVIPNEYALQQAYPNPFNPITQIQYALPEDIYVQLTVHDILGRQVAELVNSHQQAGYHKAIWNGDQNASGLYFVKMVAGKYISTQKLMLVK